MTAAKKAKTSGKPAAQNYHDYREFLRDWLGFMAETQPDFSMRKLSVRAGIAVGYLPMVIKGERKLTAKALDKLSPHLGLSESELNYLRCLQTLADSNSQEERLAALKRMQRFSHYKRKNTDEVVLYRYLTKWFHVAIRELADLKSVRMEPNWIQEKLWTKLSQKEIRSALNFLFENGYVRMDENGEFKLGEKHLEAVGAVHKIGLTEFHKQMFKLAAQSIDAIPSQHRWIMGHTLALSRDQFNEIKNILDEALQKVSRIENNKANNDVVYHTSFLAFPLTRIPEPEGEDE